MRGWKLYGAGVGLVLGLPLHTHAQAPPAITPTPAAAATTPAAAGAAGTPGAAAGGGKTIWSCLGLSKENLAQCKAKFCSSTLGQLLSNTLKPIGALSGGLVGSCCPGPDTPNPADLAQPADSELGAAAKIKQQEAQAKARRAAVRYLGTVDCHRYPEAEAALTKSLRGDQNECVRLEAAWALGRGCCCTKAVIDALNLTVTSSTKDGNPAERSERVKAAAFVALQHCLSCYAEQTPAPAGSTQPPERPERPEPPAPASITLTGYAGRLAREPMARVLEEARRTVARLAGAPPRLGEQSVCGLMARALEARPAPEPPRDQAPPAPTGPVLTPAAAPPEPTPAEGVTDPNSPVPPTGQRSLFNLLKNSFRPAAVAQVENPAPPAPGPAEAPRLVPVPANSPLDR
jgi:hypothetical protein